MLLECHNCGAPLDVADGASSARCNYCRQKTAVERSRTVALQTPAGWAPPAQWTPRADSALSQEPLAYRPDRAIRAVVRWIVLSGFVTTAVGGFIAWKVLSVVSDATGGTRGLLQSDQFQGAMNQALAAANAAANAAVTAAENATAGDQVPVLCKGNDNLTITGKSLILATGWPIVASGNCTLHLVGCTVSGANAISAKNNARVTVQGGTLEGTGSAVLLQDNASLDVSGGARLTGEATISATNNSTAQIRDSTVTGRHVAIQTSHNATVDAQGATVQGQVVGSPHAHHAAPHPSR
jgi:LSD1 subclass zinc finger protein